ncbi:DcrB family lipoprotein [Pantoea sp. Mb-10]|uniref:DcrB family lipoprotein n=1 Tax=unclassified Pantoea TaxID=2630326 RepID=UPI001E5692EF|nr:MULTISPECIES: DcrB family lipoprotein [unclassified Pantoea]MCE0490168.1 DcrB family lipoprotein [Pantoea sp. Mb-10]MCE0501299.1 DcrB family lipoprotein [Pantoea sp. Pb-8]
MRNVVKYAGIGLLIVGLAACDQKKDDTPANHSDAAATQSAQTVNLMDGKLSFSLPAGMSDKSGKLGSEANNMHVYADETGQRAIIVIAGDTNNDALDVLGQRFEQQQRNRDPQLQVVSNKAVMLKDQPAQQLDTVISANNQTSWSSLILAKVDGKLMTMQITLPADNQQKAQSDADAIVKTITLK